MTDTPIKCRVCNNEMSEFPRKFAPASSTVLVCTQCAELEIIGANKDTRWRWLYVEKLPCTEQTK